MKKIIVSVIAATTLCACNDMLELKPLNAVVVENYWEKESEVEAVVLSCYYEMQNADFTKRLIAWGELRSDNITETSALQQNTDLFNLYNNNITTSNSWNSWAAFYNVINLCNTVLYYAPQAQSNDGNFSEETLHSYEAEVRSIRALCYFYLIRTFQKVPLVLDATIGDDESFQVKASSEEEVIAQIITDLTYAEEYIWDKEYFDNVTERKGRFNKQSVKALLADVYLWNGDYELCNDVCDDIIAEKINEYNDQQKEVLSGVYTSQTVNGDLALYEGYPLIDGSQDVHYAYNRIFVTGNSFESILEIQYDYANRAAGNEGITYFYGNMSNWGSGILNAASWLVDQGNLFTDANDIRMFENTGYNGTSTSESYYIRKYRTTYENSSDGNLRSTAPNWIVYRLTDIMLMKAEALAYIGGTENAEEAFEIVKAVNERSCLGSSRLEYNTANIKEIVLDERQRELISECKRWYDLMRMVRHSDNPTQAMSTLRNSYLMRKYEKNGKDAVARLASVNNLYLPFAQSEIEVNPLLEEDQNPAY